MTRLASPLRIRSRGARADLMARSALYGAVTGAFGLLGAAQVQAASGPTMVAGLPVQAPTTPQVAGGHGNQPLVTVSGNTMTVGTDAARTLIDWNSFTVANGNAVNFTFNNRSDIVLNRLVNSTPVMINGGLTGTVQGNIGGNVWFSAPGGVVFGSTAVVNVGGMLATTALVDVNSFLNPANTSSFPFAYPGSGYPGTTGYPGGTYFPGTVTYPGGSAYPAITGVPVNNVAGGVGGVTVMSGAKLTAQGGLMALIAPFVNVAAGATVQSTDQTRGNGGAGSVLYGAANAFTVSLSQETSGDLDMLQFVIDSPSSVTDSPLLLQGTTTGTNVYVASLSAAGITGAVVDATGTIQATQASTGAGGEIILSSGADTINAASFSSATGLTPGSAINTNGTPSSASDLKFGVASAGNISNVPTNGGQPDLQILASGAATGVNDDVQAIGPITVAAGGALSATGFGSVRSSVSLSGASVTLSSGIGADGAVTVTSPGAIAIQNITSDGGAATTLTGASIQATDILAQGAFSATASTGDLTLGSVQGFPVTLNAAGAVSLTGEVGSNSLFSAGDARITAGGDITIANGVQVVGGSFIATATQTLPAGGTGFPTTYGIGAVTLGAVAADTGIDVEGASVTAASLKSGSGPVTAIAYAPQSLPEDYYAFGGAFVDVGSVEAAGNVALTANDGGVSLTSLALDNTGLNVQLTAAGGDSTSGSNAAPNVYLGYLQAQFPNGKGVTGDAGGVTGVGASTPINIQAGQGVNVSVNTDVTLGQVSANGGTVALSSDGAITLANALSTTGDILVQAAGGVTYQSVTSFAGSATLTSLGGTSFPGGGTAAQPSTGGGPISGGDVTAAGYIDVEGSDVAVGNLNAGATNPNNGYAIYAAAWGAAGATAGTLSYASLSPTYDTGQDFLYPAPSSVALPAQDPSSPFQFDTAGAAPVIGAPGLFGNGDTGETITLNARRTLIDWTSYTIGKGGEVDYVFNPVEGQNAANARGNIVLNRITGGGPVDIEGVLTSTVAGDTQAHGGNVWFSAPGGIVFGSGAVVNVGGLLATTAGFSPANLTSQFLDPTVFTFTLAGAGSGYPSGATGFPEGSGYPAGSGYANSTPFNGDVGVLVEGGAQLNSNGGLLALLGPYADVAAGAQVSGNDTTGAGAASVLYAAAPSYTLALTQPSLGGDATSGQGDLGFGSLAISTGDLSGWGTPLDLEGATTASNIYAAALSPSQASGVTAIATGALTAQVSAGGAGGEIILSTGADTIAAGQTPTLSAASIGALQLNLDNVTAEGPLRILSSGAIDASADTAGRLKSGGDLSLASVGDISLATVNAGGSFTATATTPDNFPNAFHPFGAGVISANAISAQGAISLEGSSVVADTLTSRAGAITATTYDDSSFSNVGNASIDVGSATAAGDIRLFSDDGYASLTNVTFTGSGQALNIIAFGYDPNTETYKSAYFGYAQGGPNANDGAGPTGGVGSVTGSGTINLASDGDVNLDVANGLGPVTVGNAFSYLNGTARLTADALTITGEVLGPGPGGVTVIARTGDLNVTGQLVSDFGDVTAMAPQGSVTLASATGANIYVTAAQTAHVDSATTNGGPSDPIDVTGASAYLGTANSRDDINVTATNGSATAGDLTASGAITISATNGVASLHSATLAQGTSFPGASAFPVSVSATGAGADVLIGDPVGTLATGFITGATSIIATADEDVAVNVAQPIELNVVSAGRNVSLTAPSLTLDGLQGALAGNIGIDVTADAFSFSGPLNAGGGVSVAATGGLTLGDVTAQNGDVALTSTATEVSPGSGALITVGTGPISAGAVKASGALTVAGLSVTAASLTAGSTADVEAYAPASNAGPTSLVDVGTLEAGGAITLNAGDGYASVTNLVLDGTGASLNLAASGAVYLGYAPGGTGAGAGTGSITGVGPINLTGGGDVDVDVPGAVTLNSVNATTTMANLTADSLTIGDVSAARGINLTANTGDLNVTGQALSVYGDNAINATATRGNVNLAYAAGPNIYVTAAGLAQVGGADNTRFSSDDTTRVVQVTGASVILGSAASQNTVTATATNGSASVGGVVAGDDVTVSATNGSATLGDVMGQGGVSVTATNGVASLHSASLSPSASGTGFPNTVAVSASGTGADVLIGGPDSFANIGFVTGATSVTATAGEDVTVNVSQSIELNQVSAGRNVSLTAPSLTLDALQGALAGDIGIDVTDDSFAYTTALTAGGGVNVSASGTLTLGAVTAQNGAIGLTGAGVDAGALNAATSIGLTSTGGDIVLGGDATAQGAFSAVAVNDSEQGLGAISVGTVTAGTTIALEGSSITAASLTANATGGAAIGAFAYDAAPRGAGGAFVDIGSITTGGNVAIRAGDGYASLTNARFTGSGQTLSLTSLGGAPVYLGYGQGGPNAGDGAGPLPGQGGVSAGATVNLSSSGDVDVNVTSDASLASVSAAGAVNITTPGQIAISQNLVAGGNVAMTTPGFITLQGVTSQGGSVTLTSGTGVQVQGAGQAATNFVATAITGYAPGAGTIAAPSHGSGAVSIGDVTAAAGYIDLEGTDVTSGALNAGARNPANGYYTYAAAWGADGSGGALQVGALNPAYDTGLVFLYPVPAALPPAVPLPVQDPSSPFQFDTAGAAPVIGAPGLFGNGDTGETITLNARRTLIDWTSYTIGKGGEVDYVFNPVEGQNAGNARGNIVLNRITGGGPVDIEGVLTSTVAGDTQAHGGNVWFSAPGGIVFGTGAVVNVGGLLATTAGFSPANLTSQFLDPTVFTFTLAGAGSGYPSGATGFPEGSGYPAGSGYANSTPFNGDVGVLVEGGAQLNSNGGLLALLGPYADVAAGAQVSGNDTTGAGAASVLYAAAPSYTLALTQPSLGGDATNGQGDLGFGSLAISTGDLSGWGTPLDLEGATTASNIYAAALSPSQASGVTAIATGALTAQASASGAGGEIILSTGADTIAAGQTPTLSAASIGALQLNLDNVTAGGPLRILSSGAIDASADAAGLLKSGGDLTLGAGGDIALATVNAGGGLTALASGSDLGGAPNGLGAVSADSLTAGGTVLLAGSSVTATRVSAGTAGGAAASITANAYHTPGFTNSASASVDIGSATATGDISLSAESGYASLTNVTFAGVGQTLSLSAGGAKPVYVGYAPGGPDPATGADPVGGVGSVTGTGTITLTSRGDADLDVAAGSGLVTLGAVSALGTVNLSADALTLAGAAYGQFGVNATARTGDLNAQALDSGFGDVIASATQGSVFLANTTAANVYVTAARTAHVDNATTTSEEDDPIDVTGATAYLGTANSQDDINVTATGGSATAGDLTAAGAITITATNGSASLHSATLTGGTGVPGAVSLTATGPGADVLIGDALGVPATGFITGATSVTAQADEDVTVNLAQAVELNRVSAGRTVSLTAPSLTLDQLQGTLTGDIDIDATQAGFTSTADLTAGGSVNVTAAGDLALADVTARSGTLVLGANSVSARALVSNGYLGVTARGGAITLASASAAGDLALLAAGTITASSLSAGPTNYLEALAGLKPTAGADYAAGADLTLGSATAGGNMYLDAPGAVQIGTLTTTPDGTGAINVTNFTAGALDGGGGYVTPYPATIVLGSASAGGDLHLVGQQSVTATSLSAAGAILVETLPSSGFAYMGPAFVDVGSVASTGGGDITLASAQGYASLTSAAFSPSGGKLSITTTQANAPIYLGYAQGGQQTGGGTGAITGAPVVELTSAGGIVADLAGSASFDQVNAAGAVSLAADSVTVNSLLNQADAPGSAADGTTTILARTGDVTSAGGVQSDYGTLTISAPNGDVTLGGAGAFGQSVTITAAGLASIDYASTVGVSSNPNGTNTFFSNAPVIITAGQVILGSSGSAVAANSYGGYQITATNGDATVGDIYFGGGPVTITATNGGASLHSAAPLGYQSDFPPFAQGFPAPSPSAIAISASGANGDVVIGGGSGLGYIVGASSLTAQAARDLTVQVTGALSLDTAQAGRNASVTADQLTLGTLTAGQDATLTTPNAATLQLMVTPTLSADSVSAGRDLTITSGGALTLGVISAGRNLSLTAPSVSLASLTGQPSGAILVDATASGFTDTGALSAPGGVTVTAAGALQLADVSSSQGPVDLTGSSITAGQIGAGSDVQATATSGPLQLGTVTAGGDIGVTSQGAASVGDATSGGTIVLAADGGSATLHSASFTGGPGVLTVTASGDASDISLGQGSGSVQGANQVNLQAGQDVSVAVTGPIIFGGVQAGRDLSVSARGVEATSLASGRDTGVTSGAGVAAGSVIAGQDLSVNAAGAVVLGPASVERNLTLTGSSVSLSTLSARLAGAVQLDATGGDLHVAPVIAAGAVTLTAAGAIEVGALQSTGGAVSLNGASASTGDIAAAQTIRATTSGALQTGALNGGGAVTLTGGSIVTGAVSAAGAVNATATSGALTLAALDTPNVASLSGLGVNLTAGQLGSDLTVSSGAGATLGAITVGGALSLNAVGLASLGSVSVIGAGRISARDLDIATLLSAPTLTIEARNGALTVGGAAAPTDGAMWISEAEFSRLRASNALALYAGSATGTARGALTVSDLSLDPTVTPKVSLYAAPGQTVSVTGAVAPTASGGTLAIGSTTDAAWTPSTILVSGALGAATRVSDTRFTGVHAFSQVTLSSGGDVLIGSPRFFALVQATSAKGIDIALDQPSGARATGSEIGHVYVATGQLNIDATGKVVQQNTSGSLTSYSGLYLLNGVSASKTALSIDPPTVVDLFGSFVNAAGLLESGGQASRGAGLQVLGLPAGSRVPDDYRFNGCEISPDAACGGLLGPEQGLQLLQEAQAAAVAAATTDPQLLTQSVLLTVAPTLQIEEQLDPLVTGVGNEEIWRKRKPTNGEGTDQ